MYEASPHIRVNGSCPYEEYVQGVFDSGRKGDAAKIQVYIDHLQSMGSEALAQMKWSEKMGNELWQLRPKKHRIFYYWDSQEAQYVILNGFEKKTPKTPPAELETAERLRQEHMKNPT